MDISSLSESDRFNRISHLLEQSKVYSSVLQDRLQKEREARELARQEEEKAAEASRDRKERREAREREKAKNLEKIADKKSAAAKGRTRSSRKKNVLSKSEVQGLDKSAKTKVAKKIGQPRIITGASMYDYQIHGIEWMASLYENGLNGILADEMGLGKTLQTIAFLAFLIEKQVGGPYLVVVPLSTLNNWENEFRKFAPSIPVVKFYGDKKERAALWKGVRVEYEMRGLKKRGGEPGEFVETFPVVITTYETVVMETRRLQGMTWKYLIVDEGHRIKNVNSLLLKKLKLLDTSNRLLLTGTPLQNNLTELWSLLNFLLPDVFSDLSMFQSWFDEKDDASDAFGENRSAELVETLHSILKPFLLRRLKSEVYSNLPDKREYHIYIQMAPLQEAVEHRLRKHARDINTKLKGKKDTPEIVPEPLGKRVRKKIVREDVVDTFDADLGSDDDGYHTDESVDRDLKRQRKDEALSEEEDYVEDDDDEDEEEEEEEEDEGEEEDAVKRRKTKYPSVTSHVTLAPAKEAPLNQLQKDIIEGKVKWVDGKWVKKTTEEMAVVETKQVTEGVENTNFSEISEKPEKIETILDKSSTILEKPSAPPTTSSTIPSLTPTSPDYQLHGIKQIPDQMPPKNYYSAPDGNWYPLYMHPLFPKRKDTVARPGMDGHVVSRDGFGHPEETQKKPSKSVADQIRELKSKPPKSIALGGSRDENGSGDKSRDVKNGSRDSMSKSHDSPASKSHDLSHDPVSQYQQRLKSIQLKREAEEAAAAASRDKLDPVDAYVDRLKQLQRLSPEKDESQEDVDAKLEAEIRQLREETLRGLGEDHVMESGESREIQELRKELLGIREGEKGEKSEPIKEELTKPIKEEISESLTKPEEVSELTKPISEPLTKPILTFVKSEPESEVKPVSVKTENGHVTEESHVTKSDDHVTNSESHVTEPAHVTISDSDSDEYASATEDLEETKTTKDHVTKSEEAGHVKEEEDDVIVVDHVTKNESEDPAEDAEDADAKAAEVVEELGSALVTRDQSPDEPPLSREIQEFIDTINFDRISTSLTLANLRKVANSPYLVQFPWDKDEPVDERIISDSGKMKVFDQLSIELLKRKHKILVFSQFSGTLDLLTEWCDFRQLSYCMLIGSMGLEERQKMIDAFNDPQGPSIFLITTRAGGTGINLTAADSVIIFDSDWNPQQDKQAIDRSHRIGQKNPCVIYRLISTNTMEEMLVRVASDKKRLDEMVIQAGDYSGFSNDKKTVDIDKTFLREIMTGKSAHEAHEGVDEIDDELMEVLLDRSDESYKSHRDKTVDLPKSIEVIIGEKQT